MDDRQRRGFCVEVAQALGMSEEIVNRIRAGGAYLMSTSFEILIDELRAGWRPGEQS